MPGNQVPKFPALLISDGMGRVPKVILDIEGDPHVGSLPLYVELVARLQAE